MTDHPTQPRKPSIAAIIPTYNEALNISGVLDALRASPILDEIILVDDGSRDKTVEILREAASHDPRIKILQHEKNKGKGQAIFTGWAATCASILVLLDADLKNLKPEHIQVLLEPVLERRADMTLGLFRGGHLNTDLSHWFTPFLTGQRALRSELLKHISHTAAAGYGFEVALTVAARLGLSTEPVRVTVLVPCLTRTFPRTIAAKVSTDALANGQPDPLYEGYLYPGNYGTNINVGFLVKTAPVSGSTPRVTVHEVVQEGLGATWADMSRLTLC